ncbi:MAG: hypothetical protein PUA90_04890 [bacterium]|nr:hypothetical protein [bacterium]
MKNLIEQFYNEGFATTFYKKPVKYINKKIKNKTLVKILSILIKVLYTVIFIGIAIYYLIK